MEIISLFLGGGGESLPCPQLMYAELTGFRLGVMLGIYVAGVSSSHVLK